MLQVLKYSKASVFLGGLFFLSSTVAKETLHDHALVYEAVHNFIAGQISEYGIQEIDDRLRLQSCAGGLSVRFPFASNTTVEVSCPDENGWKIYLKITTPDASSIRSEKQSPSDVDANKTKKANESIAAVVATKTLQRGIPILPGDLELEMFPNNRIKPSHFLEPQDLFGMEPTQTISRGSLITNSMVRPPMLIRKGDLVTVIYSRNGLSVSNEGEALEPGGLGGKISILLKESERIVTGTIADKGVVNLP
jgi:flagella basal body P-ring formation protein FlgA